MAQLESLKTPAKTEVKPPKSSAPRRRHTAEYKLKILKEADLLKGHKGGIATLLRREGLYSSALTTWRQERDSGALSALSKHRGPKLKTPFETKAMERLRIENARLQKQLLQANLIIEAQKKISEILGVSLVEENL